MATKFPSFSQGLAQDPTTRRIWYGIATAHDFESHDGMTEERLYQKLFSTHFGHLAIIGLWVSGNLFHVAWQGNFEQWVADPLHVRPIAHAIWDPHFGQGAIILVDAESVRNPFFLLPPGALLYPMVIIATAATVIASQAVISGAFSLTQQAIQLGYAPRLDIAHTSSHEVGQVYVPQVNWALMFATIVIVLGFRSSGSLAAAYGIAVSMTMLVTTILFGQYLRRRFNIPSVTAYVFVAPVILLEVIFVCSNFTKILESGWLPLTAGFLVYYLMSTWNKGRIFHTTLGHDVLALSCVGFAVTLRRGAEWAACNPTEPHSATSPASIPSAARPPPPSLRPGSAHRTSRSDRTEQFTSPIGTTPAWAATRRSTTPARARSIASPRRASSPSSRSST